MSTAAATDKPKRAGTDTPDTASKKKKATAGTAPAAQDSVNHPNAEPVAAWKLPAGVEYLDLFGSKMPGLKGWPVLLDTRIPKRMNKAQKAPMCVRFQSLGKCQQSCSLVHITSSAMPDGARETAAARFKAVYKA